MNDQKIAAAEKSSQKMQILEYLKEGGELTALKALNRKRVHSVRSVRRNDDEHVM